MRVVHCSVVVILAALCAFASAAVYPAASDRVKNLWEPHSDAANPSSDVLTFHMYWYLNDAKATEARCHERGPGGTAAVLQCKTKALGPNSDQVAATKAWLSALTPQCDFAWNAVHCRGVRVGDVAKLFTLPTTAFRSWVKKFGNAKRWIFTERAVRIPSACAIESISGLHHMDYITRTAKHMGQRKPPAPKTVASAAPIPPSPYGPVAPEMLINFGDFTSQGPLVVGADGFAVTFIPKCQKGSYLLYSNTVAFSKTCVTKGDIAPVSAFATFTAVDGASKTITTPKYSLSEIYNTTASYLLSLDYSTAAGSGSSSAGHIDPSFSQVFTSPVFFLPPPSKGLQGISTWGRVSVSVTVGYPDGSSVTDSLTAFYNAVDFYGNSLDPAGNIIAQRPQILITNPNPNYLQPTDFRTAYSVPNGATATQQVSGVVEFSDASEPSRGLQTKDIEWYLGNLSESGSGRFKIIGNSTIVSRGETTLDIELMMGLATGGTAYIYCLTYGTTKIVQYPDALEAFASSAFAQGSDASTFTEGISTVWSISYGGPEWLTETGAPDAQLLRVNTLLKHLTDAGITVTASSGDDGSYFLAGGAVLSPNFPASSPYVVGVGATAINPDGSLRTSNAKDGNIITSGGGYSQAFGVPSWQNKSLPGTNVTRGVPDISAAGAWIYTILDGSVQPLFGTSASSPLIASLIVLLNRAVQMHDPSKGSLRQATNFLYQQPSTTYTDVKVGDNCAGEHSQSPLSNNFAVYSWGSVKSVACFQATPGWDATTGLGAPSLSALLTPAYSWTPGSLPPDTPAPGTNPTTPVPSHGPQTPAPKEDSSSDHLLIGVCVAAGLAVVGVGFCVYRRYSNRRPAGEVWGVQSGGQQQNAQAIYASMPSNYKPTNYNTAATTDYV